MNPVRLGLAVRTLRRRVGWRQLDLARRADLSQQSISRIERGLAGSSSLDAIARVVQMLGADLDLIVRWRGGALDRLLDERHAWLSGIAATRLAAVGWKVVPEVSYAEYGERGSIDLFGLDTALRRLLVVEVKTELLSIESTLRKHDEKRRLAPQIARRRFGIGGTWSACALLVLPDTGAARRHVAAHAAILDPVYPLRGRDASTWLRSPTVGRPAGALIFLPLTRPTSAGRTAGTPHRVRRAG